MPEKIKYSELLEQNIKIEKKFILIDSRNYTAKAYEYLLSLVDEVESIAFIIDTRKIYTQGKYFGGDLWKDTLFYFSGIDVVNEEDEIVSAMSLDKGDSKLRIKGENGLVVRIESEDTPQGLKNTLILGYNLEAGIDSTPFKVNSDNEYNLTVENGKIKINEYIPIKVIPQITESFELDSFDSKRVDYSFLILGNDNNKELTVYDEGKGEYISSILDGDLLRFSAQINKNENRTFIIEYNDSRNSGTYTFIQKWEPKLFVSTDEIVEENILTMNQYKPSEGEDICGEFILEQGENKYGYFACPSSLANKFFFRDWSNSLAGGWRVISQISVYEYGILYTIFRTSQSGLGKIKWILEKQLQ